MRNVRKQCGREIEAEGVHVRLWADVELVLIGGCT